MASSTSKKAYRVIARDSAGEIVGGSRSAFFAPTAVAEYVRAMLAGEIVQRVVDGELVPVPAATIRVDETEAFECAICGAPVAPEKFENGVDYCETCYWTGRSHERTFAPLLDELREFDANASIWHTGGGCFCLVVGMLDDGETPRVCATVAYHDPEQGGEGGTWYGEAGLPETVDGPWFVCAYESSDQWEGSLEAGDPRQQLPATRAEVVEFARSVFSHSVKS